MNFLYMSTEIKIYNSRPTVPDRALTKEYEVGIWKRYSFIVVCLSPEKYNVHVWYKWSSDNSWLSDSFLTEYVCLLWTTNIFSEAAVQGGLTKR